MLFPPNPTAILPKLPLENMEELGLERLSWITGYDTEKHEWITSNGLDCDASVYDQDAWSKLVKDQQTKDLIQSILDTIGYSPGGPQSEQARQGMNILLKGAQGTGKRTVVRAICNMLKRPMFDIRANDIPSTADVVRPWAAKVASLAIQWNAVVVVDRGDYFMRFPWPEHRERINVMIQEFESPECICMWPSVLTDKQQALLRPFSAIINFTDLDTAARRQRWLQLFGREDLAAILSSSEDPSAANVRDAEDWTFIREIEKISWYELDGADMEDFMNLARSSAGGRDPTPQHVKASLKDWEAPLPVRSKVARFFALREIRPPVLAKT
ncbi:hypothetical protein CY34DRAFT_800375 [Suillus luteus UH-Slu-Lm8-n1]|uniref:ATPase dynein-related AAA domain-containing protein n=1 Tax=Suillus luteus UH-Slu-Lm8-n1 TaxID=930992 RepID=A0A0D0A8T4_9AGAM|nr:hypothetical protein CY34DRAFT_800375 [Suillus luteus UH-Slu-Lm8-n1]